MNEENTKDEEKKITKPIIYNKNFSVIQANELVRSRQDQLSLLEAKLIRLAIAQVLKEDKDLRTYTCEVSKLADFLGLTRQAIYNDVRELSVDLMKKSIFVKNKDGKRGKQNYKIFHWVDYVECKDGIITFKLSEHLKPYLVGLNELFTSYGYEEILGLPTSYSIRLYELLYSYANMKFRKEYQSFNFGDEKLERGEIVFTIEQLREYFDCHNKYPNTGDFIRRIIDPAIENINKNTVYPCSYRVVKKKQKIVKVIFKTGDWFSEEGTSIAEKIASEEKK